MSTLKAFAPAKVNLTLHVTGQRADGYHLLDSLVVFADVGDRVTVMPAEKMSLEITGPMADGVPTDGSNLVMKAADLFGVPVRMLLSKHLPAAAGIGGGSSDAAATVLAIADLLDEKRLPDVSVLGADVRVCLLRQAARMSGIGEVVEPVAGMPALHAVLVNPGVDVPTPVVFKALAQKKNAPMPKRLPRWKDAAALTQWLATQRNDLEVPAIARAPAIAEVMEALHGCDGVTLTRMSGSGATCFGLFPTAQAAAQAAERLRQAQPTWWVQATRLS
ncbi:4-(cytidine 5'-diphospho)-2-C-methyl-D-erythritol kinase [Aliiroseovarius sp.]|uniref:4-(cytidine 5'-diphospho)-2-C-methyl-D-erythritol kinase n=1 Tax=Aliiroseovarius sp. TaxID=1872442 RepID=UPI002608820A|nr:4-(cytidine 5'-diphospho)-2-C-methyl-D-erythritol kinase [Aliiroseovarius sp.]